ncbi:Retrovirus-related Pol polyprotein from transposon [Sesamum angolense]|uniref:Retrovirus-related Pol polyprotein from transposon n=1 Tax=Sesamum angolense TaxID=2727404 RepID=A0AAE1WD01_9LAMI|nr:Retrovirus-related Pol polyprotein from transposon [Sesamum angolense]
MEALEEDESLMHKEVKEKEEYQLHEVPNEEDDSSNFHISVNAMTGVHNFNTMRVIGCCKGKAIHILINTVSTHNFVDFQVDRRLGCKLEAIDCFQCLSLMATGCIARIDLKMEFYMNRRKVSLRGKQPEASNVVDAKSLRRILQKLGQISLLSVGLLHREDVTDFMLFALEGQIVEEQGKIDILLMEYADLFEEPKTLLPKRRHGHGINLREGTSAINIRPYRYLTVQKDEIEKLVQEMLDSGVIRESNNPYSSPVVLVKKEDGS